MLDFHSQVLDFHSQVLDCHSQVLDFHSQMLDCHSQVLDLYSRVVSVAVVEVPHITVAKKMQIIFIRTLTTKEKKAGGIELKSKILKDGKLI